MDLLRRAVKQPRRQAARVDLPLRDRNHGLHDEALSSGSENGNDLRLIGERGYLWKSVITGPRIYSFISLKA